MWWPRSFMHNLAFESESSCPAPSTVPLVISRGSLCTACSSHYWPQIPRLPHSSQGGPVAQPVPHIIDAHDAACGGTSARDLLHGDGVGQVVQTCPSLCLRNVHAQHPQLTQLLHLVGRQNTKWASSPGGATKHKVSFFTWWGDKTQSELLHLVGRQNTKWASSPGGATKHKVSFFTWWGDKTQSELLHLVGRQNTKWASSPGGATKHKVSFFTWWGDKTQSVFSTNKERKLFCFFAQTTMTVIFGWILQTKHN